MSEPIDAYILERFTGLLARHPEKGSVQGDWLNFIERFHSLGYLTAAQRDGLVAAFLDDRGVPLAS